MSVGVALLLVLLSSEIFAAPAPDKLVNLSGHNHCVSWLAFSSDGKLLASAGQQDHAVKLWDINKGQEITTFQGHTDYVWAVAFSPDGMTIASGSGDQTVRLWDVSSRKQTATLKGRSNAIKSVAFSRDGKTLAAADLAGEVIVWELSTNKETTNPEVTKAPIREGSLAYTKDGQLLAARPIRGEAIGIWNVTAGKETAQWKAFESGLDCVAFNPDGTVLATGGREGKGYAVKLWDVASGKEKVSFRFDDEATCVAFSADGKALAVGTQTQLHKNQTIHLIDLGTGMEFSTIPTKSGPLFCVQFSPDGNIVASASTDGPIKLWAVPSRKNSEK
jgi:WD40 repeat protein